MLDEDPETAGPHNLPQVLWCISLRFSFAMDRDDWKEAKKLHKQIKEFSS